MVFNAAQYGNAGTAIAVMVSGRDDAVEVSTENESEPIPPEVLQTLFEPLRRYSTAASGSGGNLGLGLFIVREIARAHGGEVTVSSAQRHVSIKMLLPKTAPVS